MLETVTYACFPVQLLEQRLSNEAQMQPLCSGCRQEKILLQSPAPAPNSNNLPPGLPPAYVPPTTALRGAQQCCVHDKQQQQSLNFPNNLSDPSYCLSDSSPQRLANFLDNRRVQDCLHTQPLNNCTTSNNGNHRTTFLHNLSDAANFNPEVPRRNVHLLTQNNRGTRSELSSDGNLLTDPNFLFPVTVRNPVTVSVGPSEDSGVAGLDSGCSNDAEVMTGTNLVDDQMTGGTALDLRYQQQQLQEQQLQRRQQTQDEMACQDLLFRNDNQLIAPQLKRYQKRMLNCRNLCSSGPTPQSSADRNLPECCSDVRLPQYNAQTAHNTYSNNYNIKGSSAFLMSNPSLDDGNHDNINVLVDADVDSVDVNGLNLRSNYELLNHEGRSLYVGLWDDFQRCNSFGFGSPDTLNLLDDDTQLNTGDATELLNPPSNYSSDLPNEFRSRHVNDVSDDEDNDICDPFCDENQALLDPYSDPSRLEDEEDLEEPLGRMFSDYQYSEDLNQPVNHQEDDEQEKFMVELHSPNTELRELDATNRLQVRLDLEYQRLLEQELPSSPPKGRRNEWTPHLSHDDIKDNNLGSDETVLGHSQQNNDILNNQVSA